MLYLAEPSYFNASPNKDIFWARLHEFLRRYMLKSPMAMESYFGTLESPSHHLLFLILFRAHYYDQFVDSAIVLGTSQVTNIRRQILAYRLTSDGRGDGTVAP